MATQRKPLNTWLKIAIASGLVVAAMVALHLTINSGLGGWIRSIHG